MPSFASTLCYCLTFLIRVRWLFPVSHRGDTNGIPRACRVEFGGPSGNGTGFAPTNWAHTPCKLPFNQFNQFSIFMSLQFRTQQSVLGLQCQIARKSLLIFVYVCVALMIARDKCFRCVRRTATITRCIVSVSNSVYSRLFSEL